MMAKQPEERFASMAEVVRALENLAIAAEPLPQQPLPPAARQPETPSPTVAVPPGAPDAANQTIQFAPAPAQPPIPTVAVTPGPQAAANQTVALAPARDPGTGGALILLVEPSRAQAVIIRKYLQDIGFQEITTASSGQKALELALQARPQVVISAMHLADMTGMQLAQKIGAAAVGSPPGFVLVTSQADAGEANLRSQAGDIVRLPKPFSLEELAQALAVALGSPAEPDALARASGPPSLARRAQTHDRTQSFSRLRVLIVDDSAAARKHVQGVLEGLGLSQFVEAADGARAVAAVAGETFDLIVTDYNMPYMDGRALAGYLKQNPSTASIPIIMVTTETDLGKLAAVRQLGVAAVCDKSFPVQVAREVIDRLVGMP
jgi:two-component system chemotaxis response regulator CheY